MTVEVALGGVPVARKHVVVWTFECTTCRSGHPFPGTAPSAELNLETVRRGTFGGGADIFR